MKTKNMFLVLLSLLFILSYGVAEAAPMPSVSIDSPASGATYTSAQTVSVTASASVKGKASITRVDFYDGGVLKATDSASPYSYAWSVSSSVNGTHSWTAKAYDTNGNVATSSSVNVTVNIGAADTTPPSVSINSPASGTTYTSAQTVTISASASDNVGVTRVEFYDGGVLKATDTSAPYNYVWPVSSSDNGTHSWTARAYDGAGNNAISATVYLSVNIATADTTPPSVAITSPAAGTTFTAAQIVTISASASDNVGVSRVEFYKDGSLVCNDTASPYSCAWSISSSDNGTHSWTARAYDAAGNSANSGVVGLTVNIGGSTVTIPDAPSNLTAAAASSSQVTLAWQDNSNNEANFEIWRYQGATGWVTLPLVGANVTQYTDSGLSPSTTYYYVVRAVNSAGASSWSNMGSVTTPAGQAIDTTPPSVSITSPASGSTYTAAQTVTVAASASDNIGVSKVEFYDNGVLKAVDTAAPYSYAWLISSSDNGTHSWTAKAYDAAGNTSTSGTSTVTVNIATPDTTPPSVSIMSPTSGSTYTAAQTVTVSASASDNIGVSKVEFYEDGSLKATDTSPTYSYGWSFTSANNGTHNWSAKAYDAAGNVASSSTVSVTVNIAAADTTPPTVSITSPSSGTTYTSARTVTLSASASDNSGISKVEFYDGGVLMATDTASPYSYAWSVSSANNGTHSWTAKAYDTSGNTAVSAVVSLAVNIVSASPGWNLVSTSGVMNAYTTVYNVWVADASHVWAVGYSSGLGAVFQWNGSSWSTVWTGTSLPNAIWGSSASDVWVVGTHGLVLHWNGASWSPVSSPAGDNTIYAVWGTGSNDVWAAGPVGSNNGSVARYSYLMHWTGNSWSTVWTTSTTLLTGVWGSGPNDIWAVGLGGGVLHWNGSSWSTVIYAAYMSPTLYAIWGSGSNDVWAVGDSGTILHWNGASWTDSSSGTTNLSSVWGTSANDVWAVGAGGMILHWNGSSWAQTSSPTTNSLNGIYGVSGSAWAAGTGGTVIQNQAP